MSYIVQPPNFSEWFRGSSAVTEERVSNAKHQQAFVSKNIGRRIRNFDV
jgi:hypothetical protein